jgi:hypothetical protein
MCVLLLFFLFVFVGTVSADHCHDLYTEEDCFASTIGCVWCSEYGHCEEQLSTTCGSGHLFPKSATWKDIGVAALLLTVIVVALLVCACFHEHRGRQRCESCIRSLRRRDSDAEEALRPDE